MRSNASAPFSLGRFGWPVFVLIASAASLLLALVGGSSPVRAVVVFAFLLFVPGWSFIRLLRTRDGITRWTLSVALSLALSSTVATALLYAGLWSSFAALAILALISVVGSLLPPPAIPTQPPRGRLASRPLPYFELDVDLDQTRVQGREP